jgi:hypothetical protein
LFFSFSWLSGAYLCRARMPGFSPEKSRLRTFSNSVLSPVARLTRLAVVVTLFFSFRRAFISFDPG